MPMHETANEVDKFLERQTPKTDPRRNGLCELNGL